MSVPAGEVIVQSAGPSTMHFPAVERGLSPSFLFIEYAPGGCCSRSKSHNVMDWVFHVRTSSEQTFSVHRLRFSALSSPTFVRFLHLPLHLFDSAPSRSLNLNPIVNFDAAHTQHHLGGAIRTSTNAHCIDTHELYAFGRISTSHTTPAQVCPWSLANEHNGSSFA